MYSGKKIFEKKIGVVSPLFYGSTCHQILRGIQQNFLQTYQFDSNIFYPQYRRSLASLDRRLKYGPISYIYTYMLKKWADINDLDIIWFDKQIHIRPELLKYLRKKGVYTIFFSPDDQFNPNNQSKIFDQLIVNYDLIVTTKSYNIDEYKKKYNIKNIRFINNSSDPSIFFPINIPQSRKKNLINFVGFYENDRFNVITELSKENKITVHSDDTRWMKNKRIEIKPSVWDYEYNETLNNSLINLCFLRKENRDLQTIRSIEIPMSGNLMLAERTDEHLALFKEGIEADYFSNTEELASKVKFYINNKKIAAKIGEQGRQKALQKYTWKNTIWNLFSGLKI